MASNHIVIPTTTPLGAKLYTAISSMRSASDALNALAAIAGTYNGDFATMAADFGIVGADAETKMQTIAGLVGAALNNGVNDADYIEMINRLG